MAAVSATGTVGRRECVTSVVLEPVSHMRPLHPVDDHADERGGHAILGGEVALHYVLFLVSRPNLLHLIRCEFCVRMLLSK